MKMNPDQPEALLFDLFGTLVDLDWSALPKTRVGDRDRVVTVEGLETLLRSASVPVSVEQFLSQLEIVGPLIADTKQRRGSEQSSALRFRLALERCGVASDKNELAIELSLRHMRTLASVVRFPNERRRALEALATRYRIAVLSNFDHGPTGRAILDSCGLSTLSEVSLVSDELGARKPQTFVFEHACRLLGLRPSAIWYIGDTFADDVVGAAEAGLVPVWIDQSDKESEPAFCKIGDMAELPQLLRLRYGDASKAKPGGRA